MATEEREFYCDGITLHTRVATNSVYFLNEENVNLCTFQLQMVAQTAGHLEKDTNKHISKLTFSGLPAAETTCNSESLAVMLTLMSNTV